MSKRPSFQFYPGDWMKDPAVSMCSPATRGIWVDLLCAMHENNRSGEISGSLVGLARTTRCSIEEMELALKELGVTNTADVTECNEIVTVINRRMNRDHKERNGSRLRQQRKRVNVDVTEKSRPPSSSSSSSSTSSSISKEDIITPNADDVLSHWNSLAGQYSLKKLNKLSSERKKKYTIRCAELKSEEEFWRIVERELKCLGDFARTSGWFGFDFLVHSESNFLKFSEGNYKKTDDPRRASKIQEGLNSGADYSQFS